MSQFHPKTEKWYLGKGEDESNLIAKLWWAKFCGIFYQKYVLLKDNVYMIIKDMSLDGYSQGNNSKKIIIQVLIKC